MKHASSIDDQSSTQKVLHTSEEVVIPTLCIDFVDFFQKFCNNVKFLSDGGIMRLAKMIGGDVKCSQ